jgi:curved DNA-binding protein CbpA
MKKYLTYYSILNIENNASSREIKTAFYILSKIHHPDKNNNSVESNTKFQIIVNAYDVLINKIKREEYDFYLNNSKLVKNMKKENSLSGIKGEVYRSNEEIINYLNFILWEIEDYLLDQSVEFLDVEYNNFTIRQYLLLILTFIDKWVLDISGFKDYFMEARGKINIDPREYVKIIETGNRYGSYISINDYFYEIRKRTDKFIMKKLNSDLSEKIVNGNIRLIDCLLEAINMATHYLSFLLRLENENVENITEYEYTRQEFRYEW